MRKRRKSPLTGQMTIFLTLFISTSLIALLLIGKSLDINIVNFWGSNVQIPIAPLVIGSVSIVLFAHFGAKILVKPIRILVNMTELEKNSFPKEFEGSSDELGELAKALFNMRAKIEHEKDLIQIDSDIHKALETMRTIALSCEPTIETIDSTLMIVLEAAKAEAGMLIHRDPDGGGFNVISSRIAGLSVDATGFVGMILDNIIPDHLLVRYLDEFEIALAELDPEIVEWANSRFGFDTGLCRKLIYLPAEYEGKYLGSLVLVRTGAGLPMEKLRLLAEGVITSVKYIELKKEKEENWSSIMTALSKAVDAKSRWTIGHSERVAKIAVEIGKKLMMDKTELEELRVSAWLHDVGKIAIPETILDKPGCLDDTEMRLIRNHPEHGAKIVENAPGYKNIRLAILHHHECWNGRGYPYGIAGTDIPLHARIIAIADVFDALSCDRPYRKGLPVDIVSRKIEAESWTAFDGDIVRIFLEVIKTMPNNGFSDEHKE